MMVTGPSPIWKPIALSRGGGWVVGLVSGSGDGDGDGDGGWEVGVVVVDAQQHCGRCSLIKTSCVGTFLGTDHGNRTIANLESNRSLSRRRVGGWLGVGEWGWGWGWGMGGGSGSGRCPAALWQVLSYQNQLCGAILGDR